MNEKMKLNKSKVANSTHGQFLIVELYCNRDAPSKGQSAGGLRVICG